MYSGTESQSGMLAAHGAISTFERWFKVTFLLRNGKTCGEGSIAITRFAHRASGIEKAPMLAPTSTNSESEVSWFLRNWSVSGSYIPSIHRDRPIGSRRLGTSIWFPSQSWINTGFDRVAVDSI